MRQHRVYKYTCRLCYILFIHCTKIAAQSLLLPQNIDFSSATQLQLSKPDDHIHSGMQPYVHFFADSLYAPVPVFQQTDSSKYWISRALFHNNFIYVNERQEKFKLKINPLFDLAAGKDIADKNKSLYTNTRGVFAAGAIGDKFYFETLFAESQSVFAKYLENAAKASQVVPGQGRWKNFKINGFDYAFSSGFFSAQINKHLNIQAGHGKQKIGYGYRSLLLSDNAFNYPFIRITQQWLKGKFQYTNIYALLSNLVSASMWPNPNTETLFQKKCASFQYLSYNPHKRINLGLFQGLIWQPGNSKNKQDLRWQFFNPVILSNIAWYGLNNKNNIVIGADARLKFTSNFNVYGQYMLDETRATKKSRDLFGWQAGANYYLSKNKQLIHLQAEVCELSAQQAFDHYGQTLSFTPAEGKEYTLIADYHYKRFFLFLKQQFQNHQLRKSGENSISLTECRGGFVINPSYNMNLCLGSLVRTQNFNTFKTLNSETTYFYLAFRTSIYNLYYDF